MKIKMKVENKKTIDLQGFTVHDLFTSTVEGCLKISLIFGMGNLSN